MSSDCCDRLGSASASRVGLRRLSWLDYGWDR